MGTGGGVGQEEGEDHCGDDDRHSDEGAEGPEGEEVVFDVGLGRHEHSNISDNYMDA